MRGRREWRRFEAALANTPLAISFQTRAELLVGALNANWGPTRMQSLQQEIGRYRVINSNDAISAAWADIMHRGRRDGTPIGVADAWIAATAIASSMPLATNNLRHFAHVARLDLVAPTD